MKLRFAQCMVWGMLLMLLLAAGCGSPEARRDEFMASAQEYFDQGRFEEARVELRNAIKADPAYAPAYTLIGKCNLEFGLWNNAFKSFARAVQLDPEALEARVGLAQLYLMSSRLEDMEEQLDYTLEREPKNPEARLLKAAGLFRKGNLKAGLELGWEVATEKPEMEDAWALLNYLYIQDEDPERAAEVLAEGLTHIPDSLALKLQLAASYAQRGKAAEAEALYKELATDNPDNPALKLALGGFYLSQKDYGQAEAIARGLVSAEPDNQDYRLNLAQVFTMQGEPDKAMEIVKKGIAEIDDAFVLRLALVDMLRKADRLGEAAQLAQETAQMDETNPLSVTAQGVLAEIYFAQGDVENARQALQVVFERNPKDITGRILLGRINLLDDDPLQAISEFRQVLADDPDRMEVYGYLAQAHHLNNEPELAKEALEKALDRDPGYRAARTALVNTYMREGDYNRAVNQLRKAIDVDPKDPALYAALGDLQVIRKEYVLAEEAYKEVVRVDPKGVVGPFKLGQLYATQGDADKAVAEFQKILGLAPGSFQAAEAIVSIRIAQKRYDDAMAFLDQYEADTPGAGPLDLRARVAASQGDMVQAEDYFLQAIETDSTWLGAYHRLAAMYVATGRAEEAKSKLQEAMRNNPEAVGTAYLLGLLNQETGNAADAEKAYLRALEINPDFAPAANNLAYLYVESFDDPVRLEKAVGLAEQAARLRTPETLDTLGWAQFKNGKLRPALDSLMEALALRPEDPVLLYHVGAVYKAMGDTAQAKDRLERALAKGDFPGKEEAQALFDSM